jgi:hypothetical protein
MLVWGSRLQSWADLMLEQLSIPEKFDRIESCYRERGLQWKREWCDLGQTQRVESEKSNPIQGGWRKDASVSLGLPRPGKTIIPGRHGHKLSPAIWRGAKRMSVR